MRFFEFPIAGIVKVSGEDALPYLQSQLTADVGKLGIGCLRSALRLSLKGKVLLGALVLRMGEEDFWLVCRDCSPSVAIGLLEENVIADEVDFHEVKPNWKLSAIHHSDSATEPKNFAGMPELQDGTFVSGENGLTFLDCGTLPGHCLCLLHHVGHQPTWINSLPPTEPFELELLRLQNGSFRAGVEIGNEEFPQEGCLERLSVDFDKGCYLGQEVMARIHAMGKVRRRAVAIRGSTDSEYLTPMPLLDKGKKAGVLKSQFFNPHRKEWIGAAVIHENSLSSIEDGSLIVELTGEPVHFLSQ